MVSPRSGARLAVREARLNDAARLAELSGQLGYPSTHDQVESRLREIQATAEHAVFVAELATGEVAGALGVFVMRTMEADPRAEIGGLVVDRAVPLARSWPTSYGASRRVGARKALRRGRPALECYPRPGTRFLRAPRLPRCKNAEGFSKDALMAASPRKTTPF